jgi:hypothetical protein
MHMTAKAIRLWLVFALVTTAVLGVVAPAHGASKRAACEPRGSVTIQANAEARLFRRGNTIFACGFRKGKVMRYGSDISKGCRDVELGCDGTYRYVLNGHFVAYVFAVATRNSIDAYVVVADLRRARARIVWHGGDLGALPPSQLTVTDLVVSRSGALAWVARSSTEGVVATRQEVHVADARGERLVDPGPNVVIGTLALSSGGVVYWKNGDEVRSALLGSG